MPDDPAAPIKHLAASRLSHLRSNFKIRLRAAGSLQNDIKKARQAHQPLPIAPDSRSFTVVLGVLAALPALSIDISAPTLVLLQTSLATSSVVAGLTLSLFMTGFALGQVSAGPSSDRRGRRPILLTGLVCYTVASVACAVSPTGLTLVVFRLVQGLGAGACSVLSFAIVQDLFEGDAARTKRSYVTVIFGVVPMLAPALGAWLSDLAGWRAIYGLLAILGAGLTGVIRGGVSESRRAVPNTATLGQTNGAVRLRDDSVFIGIASTNALSYGAIFAYIAGSPIVIIGQMKHSPGVFAAIFAATAAALTAGAWVSARLSRRGVKASVMVGVSLGIAAAATLMAAAACLAGLTSGAILIPPLLVTLFTRGTIAPNLQHLAIERRRDQAGAASAAVGVSQLLSGALTSAAVAALLPALGASAVAIPMALLATAALAQWHWINRGS